MSGYRGKRQGNSFGGRISKPSQRGFRDKRKEKSVSHRTSNREPDSDSDSGPEESGISGGQYSEEEEEDEDEDGGFFDTVGDTGGQKKKKNKHAPKETRINHKPVSVVRDIPGLEIRKDYTGDGSVRGLYHNRDVRFDTALGKSVDYEVVRKQYSFLDEYREREINEMEKILKNSKMRSRMSEKEVEDMKYRLQSTRSKLESLKKKDREREAVKNYMKEQKAENNGKFLTRAEKRKVILVDRFEHMNSKQKNKSIERKRKRKLGKEMRALEFNGSRE